MLLSTHHPEQAFACGDRVAVLAGGKLVRGQQQRASERNRPLWVDLYDGTRMVDRGAPAGSAMGKSAVRIALKHLLVSRARG